MWREWEASASASEIEEIMAKADKLVGIYNLVIERARLTAKNDNGGGRKNLDKQHDLFASLASRKQVIGSRESLPMPVKWLSDEVRFAVFCSHNRSAEVPTTPDMWLKWEASTTDAEIADVMSNAEELLAIYGLAIEPAMIGATTDEARKNIARIQDILKTE
jgi:hypothetical protein